MTDNSNKPAKALGMPLLIAMLCLIGTACWVLASGGNLPGKPKLADKPVSPENVLEFTALYAQNCAACHGADGKLGPAPPLNDSLFRAIVPLDSLEQVVSAGRPGTPMPAFARAKGGTLTAPQIEVLVSQIKGIPYKIVAPSANDAAEAKVVEDPAGIAPAWGLPKPAPTDAPAFLTSATEPAPTSKDYETIRTTVFARACADCHGDHGEGTDSGGAINNPEFLALASDPSLRRIIITGRRDLGMPDYKSAEQRASDFKPLTSPEIDDLVALLGQWRRGKLATENTAAGK
jgi:cytochrome c oxidase cbb3-type subunit III